MPTMLTPLINVPHSVSAMYTVGTGAILLRLQDLLFKAILSQDVAYFDVHGSYWAQRIMQSANWQLRGAVEMPAKLISLVASSASTAYILYRMSPGLLGLSMASLAVPVVLGSYARAITNYTQTLCWSAASARSGDEAWAWYSIIDQRNMPTMRANNR